MHFFTRFVPTGLFVTLLLILGALRPAAAQPNVVDVKVAPGFFEIPYDLREVAFQFEGKPQQVDDISAHINRLTTYDGSIIRRPASRNVSLGNKEVRQFLAQLRLTKIERSFERRFFDSSAPQAVANPNPELARSYFFTFSDSAAAKEFVERAKRFPGIVRAVRLHDVKFNSNLGSGDPLEVPPEEAHRMWEDNLWYLHGSPDFSTKAEYAWMLMNDVSRTETPTKSVAVVDLSVGPNGQSGSLETVAHPDLQSNLIGTAHY